MDKENEKSFPPSPFAKYSGTLQLGNTIVDCYVLDTGERVISSRSAVKAIANKERGGLADYIEVKSLKPYINSELMLAETIDFNIPGTQYTGKGITTKNFLAICRAYVNAFAANNANKSAKDALTERQKEIAINCSIMLSACAEIGLDALIDEATGYQYERPEDALQIKLKAFFLPDNLFREWEKTFSDELWEEFGRLTNWKGALHSRPKWWGKLVMELIYDALDPDIAEHLRKHKPPPREGLNYHQWLSSDVGLSALTNHINQVIGIAKTCDTIHELREKVAHYYRGGAIQQKIFKKDYKQI